MILNIFFISISTFILFLILNKIAIKFELLDYPNKRKIHAKPTPYIGGINLGFIFFLIIFLIGDLNYELKVILSFSFILSLISLVDDVYDINAYIKILLQSFPILILIYNNIYLRDLGDYYLIGVLSLGEYGKIFTFLCLLLLINAFNYSDGVDGLLSTLFINSITILIFISFFYSKIEIISLLFLIIVPVLVFLIFNFSFFKLPKIFLGDSGSNLMGFLIGSLMVYFDIILELDPALLIWTVAYIVYEFLATNLIRILNKKNLFKSGNDHFHYQILNKFNLNNAQLNIIINFLSLIISTAGIIIFLFFGSLFSLLSFIIFFMTYFIFRVKIVK